jgi:hypothetical protein
MSPRATPADRRPLSRRGGRCRLSLNDDARARLGRGGAQDDRARGTRARGETPPWLSTRPGLEQARMRRGDARGSVYYDRSSSRSNTKCDRLSRRLFTLGDSDLLACRDSAIAKAEPVPRELATNQCSKFRSDRVNRFRQTAGHPASFCSDFPSRYEIANSITRSPVSSQRLRLRSQ